MWIKSENGKQLTQIDSGAVIRLSGARILLCATDGFELDPLEVYDDEQTAKTKFNNLAAKLACIRMEDL